MIAQQGQQLRKWTRDPRARSILTGAAYGLGGFFLSAASLGNVAQPLALGFGCSLTGWRALVSALGAGLGYWTFWGRAGMQGIFWAAGGCIIALLLGKRRLLQETPLLLPAVTACLVSASGLAFQVLLMDKTPVPLYFLRIALGAFSSGIYAAVWQRDSPWTDCLGAGLGVLAMAQIAPLGFSLGFFPAGLLAMTGSFPAAAMAGLALDLSRVTKIPMTGVLCLSYFLSLLPVERKWIRYCSPGVAYLLVMALTGGRDLSPLPGLVLGGGLAVLLPPASEPQHRKGEVALAQVRLEILAGVLSQTQQLLLEVPEVPIDEDAILNRTRERACGSCPLRKGCPESAQLTTQLLHQPLSDGTGIPCRKPNRLLTELRRSQEQLRALRGERQRQGECRQAVVQQYQFLGDYLRLTADQLPKRANSIHIAYRAESQIASYSHEAANGDKCQAFDGPGGCHYVLLCDGMGTGLGAAQEAQTALSMLKKMLTAGFPAEYALRSFNSLCCLRSQAGAVTIDLVELHLDSGKAAIYKWGAAPSWLLRPTGAEKIGTAGPPPGLGVNTARETVDRLSLRRGEVLILMSDGMAGEEALRHISIAPRQTLGETAHRLLELGSREQTDDATVALIRLLPENLST